MTGIPGFASSGKQGQNANMVGRLKEHVCSAIVPPLPPAGIQERLPAKDAKDVQKAPPQR